MKINKETKIGFIFLVAAGLLYWGYNFLKGKDVFTQERTFYAIYQDVSGLAKSDPIYINGLRAGQVKNLYFENNFTGRIIAELQITSNFPIPILIVISQMDATLTHTLFVGFSIISYTFLESLSDPSIHQIKICVSIRYMKSI